MPYWDWSFDGHLPAQFWQPPTPNPLFDSTRIIDSTAVADVGSVGLSLVDGICNETDFTLFAGGATTGLRTGGGSSGQIEGTPHNYIHGTFVRGDMGGYMSPLDPIFWCHHCMIDLCWNEWNIVRRHANTNDPAWANFNLTGMFCDADGNPAPDMSVVATLLMPLLSYQYETGIAGTSPGLVHWKTKAEFERAKSIIQKGAPVERTVHQRYSIQKAIEVNTRRPSSESIPVQAADFARLTTGDASERALLTIKHVAPPAQGDVFLRVFIDKPDATAATPREDPHYAGSFYFFVPGAGHPEMAAEVMRNDFVVDITPTLKRLQSAGLLGSPSSVGINLVAVPVNSNAPPQAPAASILASDVELVIASVNVRLMEF